MGFNGWTEQLSSLLDIGQLVFYLAGFYGFVHSVLILVDSNDRGSGGFGKFKIFAAWFFGSGAIISLPWLIGHVTSSLGATSGETSGLSSNVSGGNGGVPGELAGTIFDAAFWSNCITFVSYACFVFGVLIVGSTVVRYLHETESNGGKNPAAMSYFGMLIAGSAMTALPWVIRQGVSTVSGADMTQFSSISIGNISGTAMGGAWTHVPLWIIKTVFACISFVGVAGIIKGLLAFYNRMGAGEGYGSENVASFTKVSSHILAGSALIVPSNTLCTISQVLGASFLSPACGM